MDNHREGTLRFGPPDMTSRLLQRTVCLLLGMAFLVGPAISFVSIELQPDLFQSRAPHHVAGKHFHPSPLAAKRILAPASRLHARWHKRHHGRTVVQVVQALGPRPRSAPLFQADCPLLSVRLRC